MSSFLCFICHSTVNSEISEETRDKYREIVGMNLCPDSQLCHICCHVLNKLSLFRSICLKRSLEYPVLFSEKGTINLQKTSIEILEIPCLHNTCDQYQGSMKTFQFIHNSNDSYNENDNCRSENINQYVALEEDNQFKGYFNPIESDYQIGEDDGQNNVEADDETIKLNLEIDNRIVNEEISEIDNRIVDQENRKMDERKADEETRDMPDTYANDDDNSCNRELQDDFNVTEADTDGKNMYENNFNDDYANDDQISNSDHNSFDLDVNNESVVDEYDNDKIDKSKRKKRLPKKIVLSIEEQKAALEARRKEKKYLDAEFKCYNCALPFLFKDTYQAHMMRHEESNGEYLCAICTLRFASPGGLRAHTRVHARGGGPAPRPAHRAACHLCGNLLKDANGLQQHLRRVHMSKTNRLYSCTVCGESFPSQPTLRTHMIKHISRKFPCTECAAVYSSPYTLARHRRQHRAAPQRLQCACGRSYSSSKALRAHRRAAAAHRDHALECPVCSRLCPNQRSLALHMQAIHSNTKDHACPHCPARYSTRRSLLRHVASHTHKPQPAIAVCHLCGNSFKGKSKLNRHLKNVCEKAKLEEQLASLYE